MDDAAAGLLYGALCEGDTSGVEPSAAIDAFYEELTSLHPELDDVAVGAIAAGDVDDVDRCPWSARFDRSPGHLILCCAWSKADDVEALVKRLARAHGLSVYDPQSERITLPNDGEPGRAAARQRRPWWRFW